MGKIRFELAAKAPSGARAGVLHTRRGSVSTPAFMPVATHAHVRSVAMDEVAASGAGICLANTYHLLLRPGPKVFEHFGGIHRFMGWSGGVLTDSGGFQIFSLPGEREVTEEGARFRSPFDHHPYMLSPESSVATQQAIGSDIMMVLDVCVPGTSSEPEARQAMERTHRWALRSLEAAAQRDTGQALFGIVQGGVYPALRLESAQFLTAQSFDGFAIGGLAVGEARELLYETAAYTAPLLPEDRPRYLMGVGTPVDLIEAVHCGVDLFDCIIPGKMAQQGYAYTFRGQIRVSRAEYQLSDEPLDATCGCPTCQRFSLGYLRHLAQGVHHLAARLLTTHNLWHYQALMKRFREAIVGGRWEAERLALREALAPPRRQPRPVFGSRTGNYELVTLKGGARAVRHTGHGEVMHPVGPWEEANRLYIEQLGLKEKLSQLAPEPIRVLDVGLGAAANAAAALTCADALGEGRKRGLEIDSLELDLGALSLALSDRQGFPFLEPWRGACETLVEHGSWEGPGLAWRLFQGDARITFGDVDGLFDLVFFDPFSPDVNPTLWTVDFLSVVRGRGKKRGALLATYSSATPTRVSLLLAGWYVGHGAATGTRTETTIAATHLELLEKPLGARWLERWRRSTARGPHGEALSQVAEEAILAHPQFQSGRSLG